MRKMLSMQLHLIDYFDRKYESKSRSQRLRMSVKTDNPVSKLLNNISPEDSLHTKMKQQGKFVKVDDNILSYQFSNKGLAIGKTKQIADEDLIKIKD